MPEPRCSIKTCPRLARRQDLCHGHYVRRWRYGDAEAPFLKRLAGEVRKVLDTGATTTTDDCVYFPGRKGRPRADLNGKRMQASRAVWIIANGDPGPAFVLHTCHNGEQGCINIRHLYLGDQARNCRDIAEHGNRKGISTVRGEHVGTSRLTADDVREIRRIYAEGGTRQVDIGNRFGIDQTAVSSIVLRKSWKHVA